MARKTPPTNRQAQQPPFEVILEAFAQTSSGLDVAAFTRACLGYLGHRLKKDPMEALAETMWGMYFEDGVPMTAKVRIMEAFLRCLAKVPDGRELETMLPNMTEEQLAQLEKELAEKVAGYATAPIEDATDGAT